MPLHRFCDTLVDKPPWIARKSQVVTLGTHVEGPMKGIIPFVCALAVGSAAYAAAPATTAPAEASLANFTFKDAKAGEEMDPTVLGKCTPGDIAGKLDCRGSDPVVAGIKLLLAPNYSFYNNRLTSMLFLYDANAVNFLTLSDAFTQKYGTPCSKTTEKWQNKTGATFDNQVLLWCFKTGKLQLESLGPSLNYGAVNYIDNYKAPSKATPQDF